MGTNSTQIDIPEMPKPPAKAIQQKVKPQKTYKVLSAEFTLMELLELVGVWCLWCFCYLIIQYAVQAGFSAYKSHYGTKEVQDRAMEIELAGLRAQVYTLKNSENNLEYETKLQKIVIRDLYDSLFNKESELRKLEDGMVQLEQKDKVKNSDSPVEFRLPEYQEQKDEVKSSDSPVEFRLPEYQDEEGSGLRVERV